MHPQIRRSANRVPYFILNGNCWLTVADNAAFDTSADFAVGILARASSWATGTDRAMFTVVDVAGATVATSGNHFHCRINTSNQIYDYTTNDGSTASLNATTAATSIVTLGAKDNQKHWLGWKFDGSVRQLDAWVKPDAPDPPAWGASGANGTGGAAAIYTGGTSVIGLGAHGYSGAAPFTGHIFKAFLVVGTDAALTGTRVLTIDPARWNGSSATFTTKEGYTVTVAGTGMRKGFD